MLPGNPPLDELHEMYVEGLMTKRAYINYLVKLFDLSPYDFDYTENRELYLKLSTGTQASGPGKAQRSTGHADAKNNKKRQLDNTQS